MNDKLKLESIIRVVEDFDGTLSKIKTDSDYIQGQKIIVKLLKEHIQWLDATETQV